VSAAGSRLQRLLDDAESASAAGKQALARRYVAQLEAAAPNNDALDSIAARVERRLQYVGIAGAP
jgi:hypothetical protein